MIKLVGFVLKYIRIRTETQIYEKKVNYNNLETILKFQLHAIQRWKYYTDVLLNKTRKIKCRILDSSSAMKWLKNWKLVRSFKVVFCDHGNSYVIMHFNYLIWTFRFFGVAELQ